ncbi:hypothetical protein M0P48_03680 [Candidatus Gracilibacteria bacterium]|nr:hypothetical protein [Candidatus Gracilibacteria bacterium]
MNVFQNKIVKGAILLSALTSCGAPQVQESADEITIPAVSEKQIPLTAKEIAKQRSELKLKIIIALDGLLDGYNKLAQKTSKIQLRATNKGSISRADDETRANNCSAIMSEQRTVELREKLTQILRDENGKTPGCTARDRTERARCIADTVIASGKGPEYLETVVELRERVREAIRCLDGILGEESSN